MLDNLSEIEVAYNLLKSEDDEDKGADPIDKHYRKLKTNVAVMEKDSDEFKMIKDYVSNTHATTHSHYKLDVLEVGNVFYPYEKNFLYWLCRSSNSQSNVCINTDIRFILSCS